MPKQPKFSPVMVRLSLAERAALEKAAEKECRSLSQMARLLLINHLAPAAGKSRGDAGQQHTTSVAAG
jgi:hypothetical protein